MQQAPAAVTLSEVKQKITLLVGEIAKIPAERVTDNATIDEDLAMESVVFVELLVALEDFYQIEIDPLSVIELNQFQQVAEYVHRQIVNAGA
jgi:acyl carrier protein